jgi:hypothetical protein
VLQFKRKANKVDSNLAQKVPLPAVIDFINEGTLQLLKRRYGGNNNYRSTLEEIQKRRDEWQKLIVPGSRLSGKADKNNLLYEFQLMDLQSYMFLLRSSFMLSKGKCSGKLALITRNAQSDDLNNNLDNPNTSSNFEWREINYRLASDKLLAYTDSAFSFSIDTAILDYLRYPVPVDVEGYRHFDNTLSKDIECELPAFLHPEIVNEALLIFKGSLNHPDLATASLVQSTEE